jgi:formylglycine-generating enzyme required for sulfatase activity
VTYENGTVRVQNAAVTYPTVAIDLVIRVQIQVEVNVKPTAKLLLRETPAGSYAAKLEDGSKLVLGVTEGGKWRELKSAPVTVAADQPLALEFSAVGNVLTVSLNGKPAIEVKDSTHSYGSPGLAATDGATVFRDVDVKVVRPKEVDLAKMTERPQAHKAATSPPSVPATPSVAKNGDKPPHSKMAFPIGVWVPVLRSEEDLAEWKGHSAAQATYTAEGMELDSATHEAVVAYPDSRPDTAIRARVKKISGQNLSLWLRSSPAGYSAAWFNSGNDFGVGVRVAGQPFRDLARVKTAESFSDFFDFEFATVGNQLLVFVNGCLVIKADDPSVVQGMPGIVANLGKSLFQDVQIKVLTSRDGKAEKLARGEQDRLVAELEAEHLPPWNLAKGSPPPAIAPFDAKQARAHQEAWAKHLGVAVETTNSIGMKLVLIPPGEYEMGLTTEEMEAAKQDVAKAAPALAGYFARTLPLATPKHRVRVPRPFQLGACEVTQEQFQRFVKETGYRPINHAPPLGNKCWTLFPDTAWVRGSPVSWRGAAERSQDSSEPVVDVSAMDAQAFCDWLSQKEQADYRIPTEEEWEFACRAGGAGRFGFAKDGSDVAKYGWTDEPGTVSDPHPIDRPHAIGQKLPNPFGLYDTLGNAHEVCLSSFYPNQTAIPAGYPCLRGGERRLPAAGGPPVHRIPLHPFEFVQGVQGFRIVRETPMSLPAPPEDPTAAERWVANWLLERRAELTIRSGGKSQVVSSPGSVPAGTVQVESVTFGPMARFEPAELTYLQRLPSLSVLKLDNFRIEDRAAARLVGLNKLTELRISSWRVYHSLAYLAKNESIRKVAFDNCTPDDRTLVQLGAIKNLEELTLIGHAFTTDGLRHLAGLQKLRRLVLSGTAIGDAGLKHLGGLKSLTELNLASTRVTDAGLAHLAGCEALEILDLSKTAVTGTGLAPLARLRRLVTLKLDSTKLTDEGCAALGRLTSLRTLNLHQTSLSDAGFKHLESLQDLRELNVCWTTISDAGLVSIGKLRRLTKLEMWQTVVSDLGVEPLRGLTDLQELILGWTRVGDKAADICSRFPNLQKLILQGTCVTDACTEGLGLLKTGKLISMLNTNVSPGRLSGLKAQLPSCKIEPDVFVEYSRDRNPVDVATYVTTKASAKVRLGNGETQVVTGRQWSTRVAAPFHVVELCAEDSPIGDAMLNDVRFLKSITLLNLKNARITNRGVQDLVGLKTLETLILDANPIDDSALSHLYGLTALRLLSLRATRVTPAGVQALMDKLPQCRVESDFLVTRTGGPLFAQSPATQPAPIAGLRSWAVLPAAPRDFVSAIACSPAAGNLIALAGDEGDRSPATVRMWGWAAEKKPAEKKPGVSESGGASVLLGHTKKVQALAWSPDGKYLASAGQDVTVKVWEPATDRCLRTIQLTGPATALAWSPTMDRLAVACDASVGLITLKGGELREVADAAVKGGLAWSPDGARFVIGSGDKSTFTLTVYDAATFTAERAITSEELAGRSATWSPDGKRLAAALGDRIIRMWDFETLQRVRDLTAPAGSVGLIAWSPKGDRLASAGKQLIVWDAEKGTQLASCPLESGAPLGLSWTADGEHVAVQSTKDVGVHAAADGTLVDTLSVTGPIPATKLKIQPDGHYRAVGPIAEHLVYVALTDDYRQESYTPAAFAAKFGWKNEP